MTSPEIEPVDLSEVICGPLQPGEPSWASWKCEGGPHTRDRETVHPAVKEFVRYSVIPNEGGTRDKIPTQPPVSEMWKNMPA